MRLYFFAQNVTSKDPDKNFSLGFCVPSIECNLAIITASGPALWPLVRRWLPRFASTHDRSYGDANYGSKRYGVNSAHRRQSGWIRAGDGPSNRASSFALKDMSKGSRPDIHSQRDSDEEILTGTGILRTTQFHVTSDDVEAQHPAKRPHAL